MESIPRILITKQFSSTIFHQLLKSNVELIFLPCIKVEPLVQKIDSLIEAINQSERSIVIFTSENSVNIFFDFISELNLKKDNFFIAAVGGKTKKAVENFGFTVDLVPTEFSANGLLDSFAQIDIIGKNVLFPCSVLSDNKMKTGLEEMGAAVLQIPIYDVTPNFESTEIVKIEESKPDIFAFTSPSNFHYFLKLLSIDNPNKYFGSSTLAAIGPTTKKAIEKQNLKVRIVPKQNSLSALETEILTFLKNRNY
ncbi:MAG: uroporphyrinogen-III synthase [Melioribacteraceae bacterium]|nr:uroporphyrinogen-III synthase [Melioribacteraceae bacterium]